MILVIFNVVCLAGVLQCQQGLRRRKFRGRLGAKEAAEDAEVEAADAEEVGVLGPRDSRFRTRQRALQPRGEEVVEVRGQRPRLRNFTAGGSNLATSHLNVKRV